MTRSLLILGAGQYGMVVREIAEDSKEFDRIDFLDDSSDPQKPIIGKVNEYEKFARSYTDAIVAIGNPAVREDLTKKISETGYRIPILISSKASVSPRAKLSAGVVVEPMAVVHTDAVVGIGTYISAGAVVNHNAVIPDFCHVNCNAVVMAGNQLAPKTLVSPGEIVRK